MAKIIITLQFSFFSTCIKGSWNCTQNECQSTCHIYGEGHVRTFDGESYSFDGLCQYTFLEVIKCIFYNNFFLSFITFLHMLMSTGEFHFQFFFYSFDVFLEGGVCSRVMLAGSGGSTDFWLSSIRCMTVATFP